MKPRTRFILAVLGTGAILATLAVTLSFSPRKRTTDPADYPAALSYCRTEFAAIAPASIPPNAVDVHFAFKMGEGWGGLGSTRVVLEASFRLPPEDANAVLAAAKAKLPTWSPPQPNANEVSTVRGGDVAKVRVDSTTGTITVKLSHN